MKDISPSVESQFLEISIFLLGLIFGSFLNVCIYRMPRGLSVVHPRSACPRCKNRISAFDNVPVLSWLLLRGRCRYCKTAISPRYIVVELLTGALFLSSVRSFGLSEEGFKYCVFSFLVLGLIFTDADLKLLPDTLTLPGILLGVLFSFFVPVKGISGFLLAVTPQSSSLPIFTPQGWRWISLADSLVGALTAAFFIWSIGAAYKKARGVEGMGFGDVKLMAMVGAFLGIQLALMTLMAGSLMGSLAGIYTMVAVWAKRLRRYLKRAPLTAARLRAWRSTRLILRNYQIPFGVFLGLAALVSAFFGAMLLGWYEGLFR